LQALWVTHHRFKTYRMRRFCARAAAVARELPPCYAVTILSTPWSAPLPR
jgi:hypothetical protein